MLLTVSDPNKLRLLSECKSLHSPTQGIWPFHSVNNFPGCKLLPRYIFHKVVQNITSKWSEYVSTALNEEQTNKQTKTRNIRETNIAIR